MPTYTRLTTGLLAAGVIASLAASLAAVAGPAGATSALHAAQHASQEAAQHAARGGSYQVSAKVNETEPVLGDVVKIKGVVTPAAPGQKVQLEVLYANRKQWKTIGSDSLNGRGKFALTDKVGSVRVRKYRAVKVASGGLGAGHSKSLTVTVFGWRSLTSVPSANNSGIYTVGTATINGVSYPQSLAGYIANSSVDFNLARGCKTLDVRYGLDDTSASGATAAWSLAIDGTPAYTGTFGLTQSQEVFTDVTHAFRITFHQTVTGSGHADLASPMVLCDF
jgi:hypothetical protein